MKVVTHKLLVEIVLPSYCLQQWYDYNKILTWESCTQRRIKSKPWCLQQRSRKLWSFAENMWRKKKKKKLTVLFFSSWFQNKCIVTYSDCFDFWRKWSKLVKSKLLNVRIYLRLHAIQNKSKFFKFQLISLYLVWSSFNSRVSNTAR